jgi:hypothetical protein
MEHESATKELVMSNGANTVYYQQPKEEGILIPETIRNFCNGQDLPSKLNGAIRLSTVDEDGWPHAAMLSAGEVLITKAGTFSVAIWPSSSTAKNLSRDGRMTMTLPGDGGLYEIRLRAEALYDQSTKAPLKVFSARVLNVKKHAAVYADVASGVTFQIKEGREEEVLRRWQGQIDLLRATEPK